MKKKNVNSDASAGERAGENYKQATLLTHTPDTTLTHPHIKKPLLFPFPSCFTYTIINNNISKIIIINK